MKSKITFALLMVLMVGLSGCSLFRKKTVEEAPKQKTLINEPVNLIPVPERPYVSLIPQNDGRKIILQINKLNKPATESEFELEYSAGDMIQGAFGSIDLSSGSGEYEILLGSCSAGGTCSYHKDITGGDLVTSFRGNENYAVKVPWRYQDNTLAKGSFGTRDQKFQITAANLFSNSKFVIIMETSGLPATVEGEIIAGPYGVYPANGLGSTPATAEVTVRLSETLEVAKLWGFDGQNWVEVESSLEEKTLTAKTKPYEVFVVTR